MGQASFTVIRGRVPFFIRGVKIWFDLEKIVTKAFTVIFPSIKCTEQLTKIRGKSNHVK